MHGFLNLDKPAGLTSHDCVARIRRLFKTRQVGHGGTLDPAATGVLPVAVGRATRLLRFLPSDKAYRATICLGVSTTTDDLTGEAMPCPSANHLSLALVEAALAGFCGPLEQVPPAYSAVQVQGKRLYDLARAGQLVEASPRSVVVHQITVLDWRAGELPELDLEIICGPGTYIRAIARDLGCSLGTGGALAQLRRTHSSGFGLAESLTFEQLELQLPVGEVVLPPEQALEHLARINLEPEAARRWSWGQMISVAERPAQGKENWMDGWVRVHRWPDAHFLGVGEIQAGQLKPVVVIPEA